MCVAVFRSLTLSLYPARFYVCPRLAGHLHPCAFQRHRVAPPDAVWRPQDNLSAAACGHERAAVPETRAVLSDACGAVWGVQARPKNTAQEDDGEEEIQSRRVNNRNLDASQVPLARPCMSGSKGRLG